LSVPLWATPQAQKLLSDNLAAGTDDEVVLPDPMLQWLEQVQRGKAGAKTPAMASLPNDEQLRLQYMGKSLYRCSAGFSGFLLSANVLAACKSRSAPRPTGLRPSAFMRWLRCSTCVFNLVRRNVSPRRPFFSVAVLKREYHNLHRRVTSSCRC